MAGIAGEPGRVDFHILGLEQFSLWVARLCCRRAATGSPPPFLLATAAAWTLERLPPPADKTKRNGRKRKREKGEKGRKETGMTCGLHISVGLTLFWCE
uniref:Uncharacterized protein n=1 Tax=Oryza rufipogon TaxID=4529 RepID=A0A0E0NT03_ORYRU